MRRGWGLAACGLGLVLMLPMPAISQQPVDPIRCWRQASVGAVTIGEQFTVVLTCAVFESQDAQVLPDESRLNVASIQMAPFEILGGSHPPDVRRGSRRFFQYDYQLRIISRDAIGQDVNIPALTISYRIHSKVGAAAKLEGRDLSYVLPALPIRVLSLVPADAEDIRDAGEASLAAVDSLRSRSEIFEAIAIALAVLAAVMAVLAVVPLARRSRTGTATARDVIPARVVATAAAAALRDVQTKATRDGWTDETIANALAAMRVIAAAAIDHPVSRHKLRDDGTVPEGRLRVDRGWLRRTATTISSAVTVDDLTRAASSNGAVSLTRAQQLDGLRAGLATLTAALYCRDPARDPAAIDDAVRHAITVAGDVASQQGWLREKWRR